MSTTPLPFASGDRVRWVGPTHNKQCLKMVGNTFCVDKCWDATPAGAGYKSDIRVLLVGVMNDRRSWKDGAFCAQHFELVQRNGEDMQTESLPDCFAEDQELPALKANALVSVMGGVSLHATPRAEAGPISDVEVPYDQDAMDEYSLGLVAIQSMARSPKFWPIRKGAMKAVIVITDAGMPPSAQLVPGAAMLVGSATEAKCLVEKVTWVQLPIYASSQDAVEIAHNELKLAREGRKDLRDTDVLFLLWRKNPKAFSGVHLRIIGRNLCNEAFTFSKIETRAGTYRDSYQDCDDDDRAGEEWKQ